MRPPFGCAVGIALAPQAFRPGCGRPSAAVGRNREKGDAYPTQAAFNPGIRCRAGKHRGFVRAPKTPSCTGEFGFSIRA